MGIPVGLLRPGRRLRALQIHLARSRPGTRGQEQRRFRVEQNRPERARLLQRVVQRLVRLGRIPELAQSELHVERQRIVPFRLGIMRPADVRRLRAAQTNKENAHRGMTARNTTTRPPPQASAVQPQNDHADHGERDAEAGQRQPERGHGRAHVGDSLLRPPQPTGEPRVGMASRRQ